MGRIDAFFGIRASGSNVYREVIGGLTTFATMSYIIFVQPAILADAGMPRGSVMLATCVSAALGCFFMGLIARYPFAQAPGMGENILFTYGVCLGMGFSWQAGLAIVFLAGLLFLLLSIFRTRERILTILPESLKNAIGPANGLFIAFIGLQWSGIVVSSPATMVALGDLKMGAPLLSLLGVLLIATLMAYGFRGAMLVGILATAVVGVAAGIIPAGVERSALSAETFFSLDFGELLGRWEDALVAILLFFFLDLFDTVGTLVGVSTQAGFMKDDGKLPRAVRAFFSDALATCTGALCGTSTVTSYIESATGVAAGARTGLAALVTGLCFLAAIVLAPIAAIAGQDIGPAYYAQHGIEGCIIPLRPAVAPALIVVGMLMLAPLRRINWEDLTEGLPAFLTIAVMVFGFGITEGVAAGCISYTAIKLTTGRWSDIHPIMYLLSLALLARYALLL